MPPRQVDNTVYSGEENPVLDQDIDQGITIEEIYKARKRMKVSKSPGLDGIRNEFLKSLPLAWLEVLQSLYNKIQRNESLPEDLVDIEVVMLYKKGDLSDPCNYRGISLINTILKLFTSIMLSRLEEWAESTNLSSRKLAFVEAVDHIFTLESIRQ